MSTFKCKNCGSPSYQKDGDYYECSHCQTRVLDTTQAQINKAIEAEMRKIKHQQQNANAFNRSMDYANKTRKTVTLIVVTFMLIAIGIGVYMSLRAM
ncbi:MAG TPA: hypothetical protein VD905_02435 [Flavobacteriales bacterium]|nr:hypothetical protein [Flavobacteriales bacterium]